MTKQQARNYLAAVELADTLHPCTHGHLECALTPGGRCSAQVAADSGVLELEPHPRPKDHAILYLSREKAPSLVSFFNQAQLKDQLADDLAHGWRSVGGHHVLEYRVEVLERGDA